MARLPVFKTSEDDLQKQIVTFARAILPKGWLVFAVPNGGGRNKATAGILKATGVLRGVSDLIVIGPVRQAIFAEVKTATGRVAPEQTSFHEMVRAMGFHGCIWRSLDDVSNTFRALGVPVKGELQ